MAIAATAIATSAQAAALPGDDMSAIAEAVADAVAGVNATNFTIAKTIATTPAPAATAPTEGEAAPPTPQLVAAIATTAPAAVKTDGKAKPAATSAPESSAATDAMPSADLHAAAPAQPGDGRLDRSADAITDNKASSAPADADHATTTATPAPDRHLASGAPAQPQSPALPDTMSASAGVNLPTQPPSTAAPISAAPISAAQLTATAAMPLAVPVSGLAVQIAASARSGNSRFEIRLDPAELGRIDVRLDVDRHGRVTSHLTVEKPETLAMLRQDAPQLQRALEDAGLKTGDNGLQFSLRDQSSGQRDDGGAGRQPHRLVISETGATPLVATAAIPPYAASTSRGIDIRV